LKDITLQWFGKKPHVRDQFRLFCFPYAGGGGGFYKNWPSHLGDDVSVYPVILPGRERRFSESPYVSLESLIDDFMEVIKPYLDKPFAFFGHSMGALIAFEVTKRIEQHTSYKPNHLFISAKAAPHIETSKQHKHLLSNSSLIEELRKVNGTDAVILENKELMDVMLPVIRADFQLLETYRYNPGYLINTPMTVFGGMNDEEVNHNELVEWVALSRHKHFQLNLFRGDHFFIQENVLDIIKIFSLNLSQ